MTEFKRAQTVTPAPIVRPLTTVSMDSIFKDLYAEPGTRLKQWVVDSRRESAWARETCPRVDVPVHIDNCMPTGWDPALDAEYGPPIGGRCECRNVGSTQWIDLDHDSCYVCGDLHEATASRPDIVAWRAERDLRPPITSDRAALSDEVQEDFGLRDNPMFAFLRGGR